MRGPRVTIHIQADCQEPCTWYEEYSAPRGGKWQSPVMRLADKHVLETGHEVWVTITQIQRIDAERR